MEPCSFVLGSDRTTFFAAPPERSSSGAEKGAVAGILLLNSLTFDATPKKIMEIKSKYKVATVKNGIPFLGLIEILIREADQESNEKIIFKNLHFSTVEQWNEGIRIGLEYALKKILHKKKFHITILNIEGLHSDTNPTILAYAASRAILAKFPHQESKLQHKRLEKLLYSSWDFNHNGIPDFEKYIIE